jgi:hypothetical protein
MYVNLARELKEILGLKDKNMKTLAQVWGIIASSEGTKIQPIESRVKVLFQLG